jgi:outer membrane protein, multidrug efflux system
MKSKALYILFIYSCALLAGCKSIPTTTVNSTNKIPTIFTTGSDTTSLATLSWKEYFADSSLITLIDSALINNPDALITLQRIEQAKAGVQFAKGAQLPVAGAMAVPKITRYGLYTMDGAGNITTDILPGEIIPLNLPDFLVGFQTAWEVDVAGKLKNRKKAAVARYLASVEGRNWLVTNLVAEVASAYYELVSLDQELALIRQTIAIQQNAFNSVSIQKQAGVANELAVKQFKAQLLNSQAMELEVQQLIVLAENKINFLLGRYPQPVVRSGNSFEQALPSQIQTGIPSDLLRHRPDIRQAEFEVLASKADTRAARAAFYPSFMITGGVGFQAFKPRLLFTTPESFVFNAIGSLSAPLLNRSAIKAEFNAANAYQLEAVYNYQKSILTAYVEVHNELLNIQNLNSVFSLKSEEVTTLTEAIETSNDLFRTGRATYLEVLLTQQNLLTAKLDLINVKQNQFLATINVYKALGGGWR